jgi:nucleotide-binding universal stress UspA family protein
VQFYMYEKGLPMSTPKVLIAYDGSSSANAALADLRHAALPPEVEAVVLAVADVWLPPPDTTGEEQLPEIEPPIIVKARRHAIDALTEMRHHAEYAGHQLQQFFPNWQIQTESVTDSPGWAIVKKAEAWPADLVVVGAQGHSALDRALLGSVSQMVTTHVPCSVRVGRSNLRAVGEPLHLLIGYDGSAHADKVVEEVANRHWPAGSQVDLITAIDPLLSAINPWSIPGLYTWLRGNPTDLLATVEAWVTKMAHGAASTLHMRGLAVETVIQHGNPKAILIQAAAQREADCLFVGARGLSRVERMLLGSVSTAVVAQAPCSVEIVR